MSKIIKCKECGYYKKDTNYFDEYCYAIQRKDKTIHGDQYTPTKCRKWNLNNNCPNFKQVEYCFLFFRILIKDQIVAYSYEELNQYYKKFKEKNENY